MDSTQELSLELIEGVAKSEHSQSTSDQVGNSLEDYLLRGRGGKILQYFHFLANQGYACPPEVVHLSASLIQLLTTFNPSRSQTEFFLDPICWSHHLLLHDFRITNLSKDEPNWSKLYNNLRRLRKRKYRKGAKIGLRKRQNRLDRFARQKARDRNSSLSSNGEGFSKSIPNFVREQKFLRKLSDFDRCYSEPLKPESSLNKTHRLSSGRIMSRSSSASLDDDVSRNEAAEAIDNMSSFESPFQLATVLLELLESSFCSHHSYSSKSGPNDPMDGDSPMSVAVQLVSAITALHQTKTTFVRSNSEDNDKSLSKLSFEETRWTVESVSHLQRLVLRTVLVLCHVGLERGEDLTELVHCQAVESLVQVSNDVLRRGGMIPHGAKIRSKISTLQQTDSFESSMSEQSVKDQSKLKSPSKKMPIPCVFVNHSDDVESEEENYQEIFERKFIKMKKQILLNAESTLPGHIMFVSEVISGIFGLLTQVLQSTPTTLNHKQLSEVCSLLHEFYNRNGFTVFSTLLQQIGAYCDETKQNNDAAKRKSSTPGSSPIVTSSCSSAPKNLAYSNLFVNLLSVYEKLITTIQKFKIEYLHKVGCSRHNHKSCDLTKLVPVHHNLLGEQDKWSTDKTMEFTQSTPTTTTTNKLSERLRRIGVTAFREDTSLCVIATGIKFFISLATSMKSRSVFLRETLRFLDRIGICQCVPMASIVVPLLCNLSKWSEKTQNIALSLVGKMLLHHYSEDTAESLSTETDVPTMHITEVPSNWVETLNPLNESDSGAESKPSINWRHSLPGDIKMSNSSPNSHQFYIHPVEEVLLQHGSCPWLCLCLYKPLLHSQSIDLALKVALHLQSISQHLCKAARSALMTLVFIPILHIYAGSSWEAIQDSNVLKQYYFVDDVIFIVLGLILQFLEESEASKVLFIRHGGLKVLNKLLDDIAGCEVAIQSNGVLPLLLDLMRLLSAKTLPILSSSASVSIVKPLSGRQSGAPLVPESSATQPGGVRSFLRGISFTWRSDKRRVKEMRDRATSLESNVLKNPALSNSALPSAIKIDEISTYLAEVKKFIQTALGLTGAASHDVAKDKLRKTLSFVRAATSGVDSTDSETDRGLTEKMKRKLSETSGYRSTSQEHLDPALERASNQSVSSSIVFTTDNLQLPGENEFAKWKKLTDFWSIIGHAVPTDGELCSMFLDMNGFYIALKLLNLISMGLSCYFDSEIDFTHTTVDQSFNESFAKSTSVHSSTDNLNDSITKDAKIPNIAPHRLNSIPKINLSPRQNSSLKKTASLDDLLFDAFNLNFFKSTPPNDDSAIDTPESVVDIEVQQRVLEQKLTLFTSCLRVCFFTVKSKDQFDLDVDDILSMLKPTLRARVSSITFCRLLHSSLFQASVIPAMDDIPQGIRLKSVLHGLQRTINSGGSTSASRGPSRTNSTSLLLSPSAARHGDPGLYRYKYDSSCPTSPGHPTIVTDSHYATKDDEEETLSDELSSDGYDGGSETDSGSSLAMSSSIHATPYKVRVKDADEPFENLLKFINGNLAHPELLLLSIELLGVKEEDGAASMENMDAARGAEGGYSVSQCALTTRDNVALSVISGLRRVASYSKENLSKLTNRSDVVSACLTHFADYLRASQQSYGEHREQVLSLCKALNKHHMTSNHLRLFLSLFNSSQPPMKPLLLHLLDLVDHQSFGPHWYLPFSWSRFTPLEGSISLDSDSEGENLSSTSRDVAPQRSLTVWGVAPLQMPLENRIAWPPLGGGITVSLWLKVGLENVTVDDSKGQQNWAEGHTLIVDSGSKLPLQGSPYVHLLSLGSKQTMLQVWMESTTLIFRVCIDPNDDKPVGLLAQAECPSFITANEWHHLTMTYTENKMPDKTILGKVHLVLNCFIENDVILEFNVPPPAPKSGLSSWRQNPSLTVSLQKTTFFLGHFDGIPCDNDVSSSLPPSCVSVGNVLLFNQPHPTCQSAFIIHRLGPDASCLCQCLADSTNKIDPKNDYRVRFSTGSPVPPFNLEVPPRLFQFLSQALNSDAIPDDVLLGEVEANPQQLQETLVMSFNAANPNLFHVYTQNPGTTPTRRKILFRKLSTDPNLTPAQYDPLVTVGYPIKTHRPHKEKVKPVADAGLNRSLNHVGGLSVVLLLYPKIVELTISMTSHEAESFQVLALKSVLKLRRTSAARGKEFARDGAAGLLHKVMTKNDCIIGYQTLQILFNMACSEDVIEDADSDNGTATYQVDPDHSSIIYDYELLQTFLLDWKIWYKGRNRQGARDFGVWMLLLQGLESLTRDDHPHQWFNIKVLLKAGTVQRLLEGVQEMLSEGVSPLPGADVTTGMIEVIRGLMGTPPEVELLKTLCNFVISVHPPTGTFVCHAVSNFYFSLDNLDAPKSKFRKSLEHFKFDKVAPDAGPGSHPLSSSRPKIQLERTLSLPVGSSPATKPFQQHLMNGNSTDTSTEEENPVAETSPPVVENGLLSTPHEMTSKDRCNSERHFLTSINENEVRVPRTRSLDAPADQTLQGRGGEEVHIEVSGEEAPMKVEKAAETTRSASASLESWENVARPFEDIFLQCYGGEGITILMTEALNILFIALMTMRDVDVPLLFGDYINPDMIVVFANHESPSVRTAAVRLLAVYFSRCTPDEQSRFLKKRGFQLIANQLHQHVTTPEIAESCFYLLLGHAVSVHDALPLDGARSLPLAHDCFTNHAAVLLLAILEKSFWHDANLCYHLIGRLCELFENVGPLADIMLDNGLALALCNLLSAINYDVTRKLDFNDKQLLYDAIEDFLSLIAIKASTTSGSGHFQVFEDLMVLLQTVEGKAAKVCNRDVPQVKAVTANVLLKVMDAVKMCSGGKMSGVSKRASVAVDTSTFSSNHTPTISRPDSLKLSPDMSIISSMLGGPTSPAHSDNSDRVTPVSPRPKLQHQRSHSTETGCDVFHLPSPNLGRRRTFANSLAAESRSSSSFRARTSALRSRSFKGNQRRRMNEGETATRLQRAVTIAVNKILYTEKKRDGACKSKAPGYPSFFSSSPLKSPLPSANGFGDGPQSMTKSDNCTFSQTIFDLLTEWLIQLVEATDGQRKRLSTNQPSGLSWERILHLSQAVLIEQTSRLLLHLVSPWQVSLRQRTHPFSLINHNKSESLLAHLLPNSSTYGQKIALCIHYLLTSHKHQLSKHEKHDGKKWVKTLAKLGHRVPSHYRRAACDENGDKEPPSPAPTDELQDNCAKERRLAKADWKKMMSTLYQLLVKRTSALADHVSRHAMEMTQVVVLQQNKQRKLMIGRIKDLVVKDLYVRKKWTKLLQQLAHEKAVWYNPDQYPQSWQLDPTEGPFRERRRLQRCHIDIDRRFLLKNSKSSEWSSRQRGKPVSMEGNERYSPFKSPSNPHQRPLAFLFEDDPHSSDAVAIRTRLQTNERIRIIQSCTNVTVACETPGEILIGEQYMYFVGDQAIIDPSLTQAIFGEREIMSLSWEQRDVIELQKRWWQLRDTAIEIFLSNGTTYLLAFKTIFEREYVYDELILLDLPNLVAAEDFQSITKSWCAGKLSNFDYLTRLNKTAGRSFNDLMQYPVMPFVIADYTSQMLDLEATTSYRILGKPISVQEEGREQHFKERYRFLEEDYKNCTEDEREMKTPPFHYGSHYSNSGTVLHFLVRLPPFTQLFLEYQDASFDIPDRTFHSMATTYKLSSYASTTDVKELIPEFFFLPEFLCNLEGFDFGLRQCGVRVHHVTLPPWCREDPRLFVLIHRQALENEHVTQHLHEWIDLVFGYKQTGEAALDAVNVFHPATYFGMDISSVDDPVKRKALETMVKTYGQTPKLLFSAAHPPRVMGEENVTRDGASGGIGEMLPSSILGTLRGTSENKSYRKIKNSKVPRPIPSVKGIQWGGYVGSPSAPDPAMFLHKLISGPIGALAPLQTNDVCALAPKMGLLVLYARDKRSANSSKPIDISWSALLTHDKPDNIIRLKLKHNSPGINLARFSADDHVTCCVATPDCRSIILGSRSGIIFVQKCNPAPEKGCDIELLPIGTLYCHTASVTCLDVCGAFRVFVSGSMDGTATLWDLDSLSYIRSLTGHSGPVTTLAVSQTSGDVCTVCDTGNDAGSHIRLWTVNGSLVAAQDCRFRVRCVAFSNAPEGLSVNVVAGGLENGTVRLWSSWNLAPVRDIKAQIVNQPITSVTFTHNSMVLYAATEGNLLCGWCRKDKEKDKQPLLITFVDSKTPPHT